jgi:hypothetical protein
MEILNGLTRGEKESFSGYNHIENFERNESE